MDKHTDIVNHPSHYELAKFECIEVMEEVFGKDALKNYCVIAAFKYLWRCDRKGRKVEDFKKARWYLDKYIELEERDSCEMCSPQCEMYSACFDDEEVDA